MPELLNPDAVFEYYRPIVEAYEPHEGQDPLQGPPGLIGLITDRGLIIGPVFGDFSDPAAALGEMHPAMLPHKPHLYQAVFATEAVGDYDQAQNGGIPTGNRSDMLLMWGATPTTAWFGMMPLTRTFSTDEEGRSIAAVKFATILDEKPPVWKQFDEGEDISQEPVLTALRTLVLKDPGDPPRNGKFTLRRLDNQEEAE